MRPALTTLARGAGAASDIGEAPLTLPAARPRLDTLKVALVHDWFVNYAGSEKVVEQMLEIFPQAEVFAVVDFLGDDERAFLGGRRAHTTFVQRLPRARKAFRNYLPLMPLAVEQFDLSGYDLVLSSSHAVAKGVITGPAQVHVSYVHTPIRYAWDLQHQYLQEAGLRSGFKSLVVRLALHYLRLWDSRTAHGVDAFVANSRFIARRIRKIYGRDATVVYPPVDLARFTPGARRESFYLAASRMVPYKRMPMIAEAFAGMPDKTLVVIGDGPDLDRVQAIARTAPNVRVLGYVESGALADYMSRARAFVFAAEEDFGITPVEAQACGTPVIAYGAGGALETVIADGGPGIRTGVFFERQTAEALADAVRLFEASGEFQAHVCRANAERFSTDHFREGLRSAVQAALASAETRV